MGSDGNAGFEGARPATRKQRPGKRARAKFRLGPYWLAFRRDREEWCICWNDSAIGDRRRIGTGIGGRAEDDPPVEAQKALAAHFAAVPARATEAQTPAAARFSPVMTLWLEDPAVQSLARAPEYARAIGYFERFFGEERAAERLAGAASFDDLTRERIGRYIASRKATGVKGETINDEIKAVRIGARWAVRERMLSFVPFIPGVEKKDRSGPKELTYTTEQIAAILETAARRELLQVSTFTMISMSTHGRTEAILELFSSQISRGLIHFNAPGRLQTSKKRSIVPVAPSLAPWLEGINGKIVRARIPVTRSRWQDPDTPEWRFEDVFDIGKSFDGCLVAAGLSNPTLELAVPRLEADGSQRVATNARTGEQRPMWRGLGSPNTLRHTLHTWLQTVGVPQAQIDAAAGHSSEQGSGRNYTHLRPEYLKDFVAAIEAYWADMAKLTDAHIPAQFRPQSKVHDLASKRKG